MASAMIRKYLLHFLKKGIKSRDLIWFTALIDDDLQFDFLTNNGDAISARCR
jgi:hypothetical protein